MDQQPGNPLHGITLEAILTRLVEQLGWPEMARRLDVKCFRVNPSIKSSLTFLRRTPWARKRVEEIYLGRDEAVSGGRVRPRAGAGRPPRRARAL